jgi:hypothetical protein
LTVLSNTFGAPVRVNGVWVVFNALAEAAGARARTEIVSAKGMWAQTEDLDLLYNGELKRYATVGTSDSRK